MVMLAKDSVNEFQNTAFGRLIERDLRLVVHNHRLWSSFLHWSKLTREQALQAVSGGTFPYVDCLHKDGTSSGCFRKSKSDTISVFYYDITGANGTNDGFKQRERLKDLEFTVLHELVHWGRHLNGFEQTRYSFIDGKFIENGFGDIDVGKRFELEAYPSYMPAYMPVADALSF